MGDPGAWDGEFVRVTLGQGVPWGDCGGDRRVGVGNDEGDQPQGVYDAALSRVPIVEEFPPVPEPGDVTRFAIAPFPGVDCVDAAVHGSAEPQDPGEALRVSRGAEDLRADLVVPPAEELWFFLDG